jgi:hypothetical protein
MFILYIIILIISIEKLRKIGNLLTARAGWDMLGVWD